MSLTIESLESRTLLSVGSDYAALLHRTPAPAEVAGWQAYPADVRTALITASDEYRSGLTPRQWLGHVYGDLLGRSVDPTGVASWLPGLVDVPSLFRAALGIVHSEEYALRGGIDPITFPDGSILTAEGVPVAALPVYGGTVTLTFANEDGTTQQITVQDITFPPGQGTVLTLYAADGTVAHPTLPTTALGTGFEPALALDGGTAYLAVAGYSTLDGSALQMFASVDGGRTWALRGQIDWPAGTPLSGPNLTANAGTLTLSYTANPTTITWTSADLTHQSDAGVWTATNLDGGMTWNGRGVKEA